MSTTSTLARKNPDYIPPRPDGEPINPSTATTNTQALVSLDCARKNPDYIPPRPDGKAINRSTLQRWIHKGLAGEDGERIRLEVTYAGNRPYVTKEALDDFFQTVTAARLGRHRGSVELAAASDNELEAAGLR